MREDDGVIQEFRAICCARVHERFVRAYECMSFARMAYLEGNRTALDKWLSCVRALRNAAASWRSRAIALTKLSTPNPHPASSTRFIPWDKPCVASHNHYGVRSHRFEKPPRL